MKQKLFETLLGMVILSIAFTFLFFSYRTGGVSVAPNSYVVSAEFDNIDGIASGADIKISGIKIGKVGNIILDQQSYYAKMELLVEDNVKLPVDSRANIVTSGLIGSKYIQIEPGIEESYISNGGKIVYTKSAVNIESLINKLVYSFTKNASN